MFYSLFTLFIISFCLKNDANQWSKLLIFTTPPTLEADLRSGVLDILIEDAKAQ